MVGNPLTLCYLGQCAHMFDAPEEEPILMWTTFMWLLEDYGLSRTEEVPTHIQYKRISRQWYVISPAVVANHPHLCPCSRRNKCDPIATIPNVEYNWPLISGPKSTAVEYKATYKIFFQ